MDAIPVPTFDRHNTCLTCGHDLYGQPRSGVCPECGASTRESARHERFLARPGNAARLRDGARLLCAASVLSGLGPGVVLVYLMSNRSGAVALVATVLFAAAALTAEWGEQRFDAMFAALERDGGRDEGPDDADVPPRPRLAWRAAAATGLAAVGLALHAHAANVANAPGLKGAWLVCAAGGVGFALLAATAWRAVPGHALRAGVAAACVGARRSGFAALGVVKAIYETAWFGACALTFAAASTGDGDGPIVLFLAFAVLFGLSGFVLLWLVSVSMHAALLYDVGRRFGRTSARGFEVVRTTG